MVIINEDEKIKVIDYKNQFARQFSKDTHLGMVTKAETKEELDNYYKQYLNMTVKQKFKANNMALRIFGMTNDQLYQLYIKDFVKDDYDSYVHLGCNGFEPIDNDDAIVDIKDHIRDNGKEMDDSHDVLLGIDRDNIPNIGRDIVISTDDRNSFVGQIHESMIIESIEEERAGLINTTFFTPNEILSFGEDFYSSTPDNTNLTKDVSVSDWFSNYIESFNGHVCENLSVEWMNKMRELYSDFNNILESGDEDAINNRKQSILNLGWNPEIDFNENNILVGKQRIQKQSEYTQDIYKDYSNVEIFEETILSESVDASKFSGVYIVLTKGKTPIVSDSISFFTNSEYTHAGIAFDAELDEIYSFNMKKDDSGRNGFVIENIRNDKCVQSVFVLFVEKHKVKEMISQVKDFQTHKTIYDFGLLVGKAVNAKHNKDNTSRKYNQVCSSFVDTILHYGEIEFVHTKNNSIASPADIYNSITKTSNKIYKVYEGPGKSYDTGKTLRVVRSLMGHSNTNAYTEDYIEEKAKPNLCYKVSYEGSSDILQELKMKMFDEDRGMKSFENFYEKKCAWMKPTDPKAKSAKIFLKEKGLKKFKKDILPTIDAYLDKKKVKVDSYSVENDKIVYTDEYVIATKKALVKVTEDYEYVEETIGISGVDEDAVRDMFFPKIDRYGEITGCTVVKRMGFDDANTTFAYQPFTYPDKPRNRANVLDYLDENTYVIGDTHFTKFDDKYDKKILKLLTSIPEDATLVILGDIGYVKTTNPKAPDIIRRYFKQIKCKNMFLVMGNHDAMTLDYYYSLGFKGIYDRIIDNKHKWTFSHQPYNGDSSLDDYINLHGHIHGETVYPKGIKNLSNKINCWTGYCDDRVKTIREWIDYDKSIRKAYTEAVIANDSYIIAIRESYSTIGMYVEEEVQDYMESKDRAYNLDKWESKKANVIYITGASGSGKSTIAKRIAEEYGAEWVPLDTFFKYGFKKNENIEFDERTLKLKPTIVEYINKIGRKNIFSGAELQTWNDIIDEKYSDKVKLSLKKLFAYLESKSSPNKRFAVEGFQLGAVYDVSDLSGKPLIVKGNSFAKTQYRRIKREFDKGARGKTFVDKTKNAANMVKNNIQYATINKKEYGIIDDFDKNFRNESTSIEEAISMDDEGNMLIYRATLNTINYGDEIKKSSDLCKLYKESSNLDGLKYELCKLWYINAMLEKRIKRNDSNKDTYMNNRRVCLNIFKTYMKHVLTLDDDFNFEAFYNSTPYGGAIRIDKNTLKYSVKALKELMK